MAYLALVAAIVAEVVGTSLLRSTEGFTRLLPSVACLGAYALSFVGLASAVQSLPVGVVYATWSGLGTVAIVGIGATLLDEPVTTGTVVGVLLVVGGVVVLNLGPGHV